MSEEKDNVITFSDLYRIIKRHIIGILVCFVVSILLSICYAFFVSKPTYVATASVIVNAAVDSDGQNQSTSSLAYGLNIVNTYIDFVETDLVNDTVRNKVKPKEKYSVMTSNNESSLIVKVTVKSKNKEEAIQIANGYVAESLYLINNEESTYLIMKAARISSLDTASDDNVGVVTKKKIILLLGILLGFVSSCVFILIRHAVVNNFTNINEIENNTNLELLGAIPDIEDHDNK